MGRLKRSVTYCLNNECEQWLAPRFHLGPIDAESYCHKCNRLSTIVPETFVYEGGQPWRQVRVEYDYFPPEERYRGLAIVTNEDMESGGVHTFKTPLVKTPKRALEVAEARLSNLSLNQTPEAPYGHVNFDLPLEDVKRALRALEPGLEQLAGDQHNEDERQQRERAECERHVPCVC